MGEGLEDISIQDSTRQFIRRCGRWGSDEGGHLAAVRLKPASIRSGIHMRCWRPGGMMDGTRCDDASDRGRHRACSK